MRVQRTECDPERQHVGVVLHPEVIIILVPRLNRADLGRLHEELRAPEQRRLVAAEQLVRQAMQAGVVHKRPVPLVLAVGILELARGEAREILGTRGEWFCGA